MKLERNNSTDIAYTHASYFHSSRKTFIMRHFHRKRRILRPPPLLPRPCVNRKARNTTRALSFKQRRSKERLQFANALRAPPAPPRLPEDIKAFTTNKRGLREEARRRASQSQTSQVLRQDCVPGIKAIYSGVKTVSLGPLFSHPLNGSFLLLFRKGMNGYFLLPPNPRNSTMQ